MYHHWFIFCRRHLKNSYWLTQCFVILNFEWDQLQRYVVVKTVYLGLFLTKRKEGTVKWGLCWTLKFKSKVFLNIQGPLKSQKVIAKVLLFECQARFLVNFKLKNKQRSVECWLSGRVQLTAIGPKLILSGKCFLDIWCTIVPLLWI